MVVVSHLSLFLGDKIRGRCDSCESHLPLIKTIYFPIAPSIKDHSLIVMRTMGLEPTRHECHKILSLARLPVPTLPHSCIFRPLLMF